MNCTPDELTGLTTKYGTLLNRLRKTPVTISHTTYTYAATTADVSGFLDNVRPDATLGIPGWPGGAKLLQTLWTATRHPAHPPTQPAAVTTHPASIGWSAFYNGVEQQDAVLCTDSPNPHNPGAYPRLNRTAVARSGAMGLNWLWMTEPCTGWRGSSADRYSGPWNRRTAHPILLIGNTGDPVTPTRAPSPCPSCWPGPGC